MTCFLVVGHLHIPAGNPAAHRTIGRVHLGPIVLNGRAAARARISGVERWAAEVNPRLRTLRPDRYIRADPPRGFAHKAGQAWEQAVLPARAARSGASIIFSPANLAPLAWPRNVVVIHDAAVLRNASDYSRAYRAWHGRLEIACARQALKVVTVSEFSRGELVALSGLDPDKVAVIPGGVDKAFRPDADAERVARSLGLNRPYVLTVGSDDARKNLGALAATVPLLKASGLELVWAGADKGHMAGARSVDGIRQLGYVPDSELPGLYAGARAFVLPSRYEGFGLTCLEAMACGTPVVAANRAALPETCAGAALFVDPEDPSDVAQGVIRAASEQHLRTELREAGLRRAAECTWERTSLQTDALLMSLVDR
jgi:glycosyltransferase involved in cell wall biosynthesis